ncbi:trypsin-like cysteine/serine peptidase domain-containing protein [Hyaloraphidium curvatum]|nr:trypsin-like cysteine/serine peptidase domain-containing protein [Hyaloraphidium curvatum]
MDTMRHSGQRPAGRRWAILSAVLLAAASLLPRAAAQLSPNIVGGNAVSSQTDFPFMAAMRANGRQVCGGSLVAPGLVLSAAHCAEAFPDPASWTVFTYRRDRTLSTAAEGGTEYAVAAIEVHPRWDSAAISNDAALFFLTNPTVLGIYPPRWIALNRDPNFPAPGSALRAVGWGTLFSLGPKPDILQEVTLSAQANDACTNLLGTRVSNPAYLCAGAPGRDTCQGDSGGPLLAEMPGGPVLVGLTSYGIGCASPFWPNAVYARVSAVVEWVDGHIRRLAPEVLETSTSTTTTATTATMTSDKTTRRKTTRRKTTSKRRKTTTKRRKRTTTRRRKTTTRRARIGLP